MQKLTIILILTLSFTVNIYSQTCNFFVDTITKNINCGDSVQLISSNYKTTTYLASTQNHLTSVHFPSSNVGYAVGMDGTIIKTIDAGKTWSTQTSGTNGYLTSVFFNNVDTGYAVGYYGDYIGIILKTTDGGINWTTQTNGTINALNSVCFTNIYTGYAVGGNGTILKTTDGGNSWIQKTSGNNQILNSVFFSDANTGYAVGNNSTVLKTIDSGASWTTYSTGISCNLSSVYFTDVNNGYTVSSTGGYIFKTTDGGQNWVFQNIHTYIPSLNSIYFIDANTGYAVGVFGTIIKTTNGGINWSKQIGVRNFSSVYFPNANTGYAVSSDESGEIVKISSDSTIFNWQPNNNLSDQNSPNPIVKPTVSTTYKVTITPVGCSSYVDSVRINIIPIATSEICMVSIRNNKNLIIWDKPISTVIDSSYIWRETDVTGNYEKIGAVAYKDSSIFVDTTSNPTIQSNRYVLSHKDQCGIESNKSSQSHKTMHLSINQGLGGVWNLIWESYEGFIVNTYKIYRGTTPDNLSLIGTTAGGSTQFTDNNPPQGFVYYQVQVVSPNDCNPSRSNNSYNISKSNTILNDPNGISSISLFNKIKTYPNPVLNELNIKIEGDLINTSFEIINSLGQVIYNGNLPENKVVQTTTLTSGVYLLKIKNDQSFIFKKIVKE